MNVGAIINSFIICFGFAFCFFTGAYLAEEKCKKVFEEQKAILKTRLRKIRNRYHKQKRTAGYWYENSVDIRVEFYKISERLNDMMLSHDKIYPCNDGKLRSRAEISYIKNIGKMKGI